MHGPDIIARTISAHQHRDDCGNYWQYHSRSDHHSKVACWAILYDLLIRCDLLRRKVKSGSVAFGINHPMSDFRLDRRKSLDLVLCTPHGGSKPARGDKPTFKGLQTQYGIQLTEAELEVLADLPDVVQAPVGSVHVALEAKACMTEHSKARPRLYDELNSSHASIHGSSAMAIAVGLVMVNASDSFLSPGRNRFSLAEHDPKYTSHKQPKATEQVVEKLMQLPRRADTSDAGFDSLAIVVVDCRNDGETVSLVSGPPAPREDDIYSYSSAIERVRHLYESRFPHE